MAGPVRFSSFARSMIERAHRSRLRAGTRLTLFCLTVLGVASACRGSHSQPTPLPQPAILVVRNEAYFDVNIYVMSSTSGSGIRLATVTGNSTATLRIPPTQLQMGYVLAVRLHAIGSNYWWNSPSVTMDAETIAHLDIVSDPDGNLSRSTIYTSSSDTTGN